MTSSLKGIIIDTDGVATSAAAMMKRSAGSNNSTSSSLPSIKTASSTEVDADESISSFVHSNASSTPVSVSVSISVSASDSNNNNASTTKISKSVSDLDAALLVPPPPPRSIITTTTIPGFDTTTTVPISSNVVEKNKRRTNNNVQIAVQQMEETIEITRQRSAVQQQLPSKKKKTTFLGGFSLASRMKTPSSKSKGGKRVVVEDTTDASTIVSTISNSSSNSVPVKVTPQEEEEVDVEDETTIRATVPLAVKGPEAVAVAEKVPDVQLETVSVINDKALSSSSSFVGNAIVVDKEQEKEQEQEQEQEQEEEDRNIVSFEVVLPHREQQHQQQQEPPPSMFFSAMEEHLSKRRSPSSRQTKRSIEKKHHLRRKKQPDLVEDSTDIDIDSNILSPSLTNRVRKIHSIDLKAMGIEVPRHRSIIQTATTSSSSSSSRPKSTSNNVVQEQEEPQQQQQQQQQPIEEHEEEEKQFTAEQEDDGDNNNDDDDAIEVEQSGSVIVVQKQQQQQQQQRQQQVVVKEPYRLVRIAASGGNNNGGGIEVLRSCTTTTDKCFSYDKNDEDEDIIVQCIIGDVTEAEAEEERSLLVYSPPTPIKHVRIIGVDDIIEAVIAQPPQSLLSLSLPSSSSSSKKKSMSGITVEKNKTMSNNKTVKQKKMEIFKATTTTTTPLRLLPKTATSKTSANASAVIDVDADSKKKLIIIEEIEASSNFIEEKKVDDVDFEGEEEVFKPFSDADAVPVVNSSNKKDDDSLLLVSSQTSKQQVESINKATKSTSVPTKNNPTNASATATATAAIDTPQVFFQREEPVPPAGTKSKAILVPKLPAPKKDTIKLHDTAATIQRSLDASLDAASILSPSMSPPRLGAAFVSPSASMIASHESSLQKTDVSSSLAKRSGTVVGVTLENKATLRNVKHVVHVNVLGIAGIVVDRKSCKDVTGHKHSPAPPEQMKAVVGITEFCEGKQENTITGNVTTFSSTLIHSPNTKLGKSRSGSSSSSASSLSLQRHIAVWASNNLGETPGSIIESKALQTEFADEHDPNSKYVSKFLTLSVALAKNSKTNDHVASVIGSAGIKVSDEMMRTGEDVTMDLPIYVLDGSASSFDNRVIKLKTTAKRKGIIRKLFVRQPDRNDIMNREDLMSAYSIDPSGDSMIRVQVRVETLPVGEDPKIPTDVYDEVEMLRKESKVDDATVTTELSDGSSILSGSCTASILPPAAAACRAFDAFIPTGPQKQKNPTFPSGEELYSKPLDMPSPNATDNDDGSFHTVSWKGKLLLRNKMNDAGDPGCKIFGNAVPLPTCTSETRMVVAKTIDDKIEEIAEHVFEKVGSCPALNVKEDSPSIGRSESFTTMGNDTFLTIRTAKGEEEEKNPIKPRVLLQEIRDFLGPVPTMDDVKHLAKELAETSGEYFFPEDPKVVANEDDDDNSSVGSATLVAFESGQLRMRSIDSPTWGRKNRRVRRRKTNTVPDNAQHFDDDILTCSTAGSFDSEPTIALNQPFGQEIMEQYGKEDILMENNESGTGITNNNKTDDDDETRTLESYPTALEDVGCEGDHEDSTLDEGRTSIVDGDEEDNDDVIDGRREVEEDKLSLPSVVKNIAEALSLEKACGYFGSKNQQQHPVPETVDPSDVHSVGDLTAITLEKNEIRKRSRRSLLSRLSIPKGILTGCTDADIEIVDADDNTMMEPNNSMTFDDDNGSIVCGQPRENYFADYENGQEGMSPLYARKQIDCPQLTEGNEVVETMAGGETTEEITTNQNAHTDTVLDGTSDLLLRIEEGVEEEDEDCC
ncbi:hypothetical protein FRACYDRAFT_238570 [Fragilariopsis cylindrus CCMP1102]|uniref:Uncharacterized protein n=1 Tax=Fragilariopsis cylindrus CCMP1102 TaxID=635003 RepID=A0A1E7FJ08_9STRA|nr:hypothetical protein FRACYDRAFT_238570 [Fragilariopsis cylindrus CCMP1102]|eukprot:OEU18137.1 hypothetical protein FRACYDRAFT_238570 [Fragilariopsis cylindrus CCMP1102]